MSGSFSGVIFDLDGTLLDSGKGIFASVRYALDKMGLPPADENTLKSFIGPSLYDSFTQTIGLSETDALRAIDLYREKYLTDGIDECALYPGCVGMLEDLRRNGIRLSVASSKPRPSVERLLQRYEIARLFEKVSAPEPGVRDSGKAGLVRSALLVPDCVMAGDRKYDVLGARENGLPTVWAAYGYAPDGEMEECRPEFVAHRPREITEIILSERRI